MGQALKFGLLSPVFQWDGPKTVAWIEVGQIGSTHFAHFGLLFYFKFYLKFILFFINISSLIMKNIKFLFIKDIYYNYFNKLK